MLLQQTDSTEHQTSRQELVEKMQAGRRALAVKLDGAPIERPVLTNGWTARDLLIHLGGWEERIAGAYTALASGADPDWELERMTLDELNARMLAEAADLRSEDPPYPAARAAEERAYQRLLEIARTAPSAHLFDPARFVWMKAVPFAEWIRNNSYEHIEEHLLDWVGGQ